MIVFCLGFTKPRPSRVQAVGWPERKGPGAERVRLALHGAHETLSG